MEETEYKALMFGDYFVNEYELDRFISGRSSPMWNFLHSKDETFENLLSRIENSKNIGGRKYSNIYIENLKKCELVSITIKSNNLGSFTFEINKQ